MKDLPDKIDIDITKLGIGKQIVAGDVKIDNVNVLSLKTSIICAVRSTRQSASQGSSEEPAEAEAESTEAAE